MVLKFGVKVICKKIMVLSFFASGMLIGMHNEYKYSVIVPSAQSVIGSIDPKYPVFVHPKGKNQPIAWRYFAVSVASTRWDTASDGILHVKLSNGQIHILDVSKAR